MKQDRCDGRDARVACVILNIVGQSVLTDISFISFMTNWLYIKANFIDLSDFVF